MARQKHERLQMFVEWWEQEQDEYCTPVQSVGDGSSNGHAQ